MTRDFLLGMSVLGLAGGWIGTAQSPSHKVLQRALFYETESEIRAKAELLQVGIFFLIHLFAGEILLLKKLEIEETKTT